MGLRFVELVFVRLKPFSLTFHSLAKFTNKLIELVFIKFCYLKAEANTCTSVVFLTCFTLYQRYFEIDEWKNLNFNENGYSKYIKLCFVYKHLILF